MIRRSRTSSVRSGLTLVEVVAGLALLGSVLAALLVARSRHLRQSADAEWTLRATDAADALLTQWWTDPQKLPRDAEGAISGQPDLRWRTRLIRNPRIEELGGRVVRLEVSEARARSSQRAPLVVSVEVVVPEKVSSNVVGE